MYFPNLSGRRLTLLVTLCAVIFTPGIQAQSTLLEEVIVTAQKREESLQDVPIAISALTGDQLSKLGIETADDLMKAFPNLIVKPGGAINMGFSIRGVGTDNFHVTAQQAVGQYLDEVSLVSPFVNNFGLFDMERVEVLRGPQNTLFGRNTTGGAVNMISRKPEVGGELNGYAQVNGGNEGRIDFEGAVGLPLGDSAAVRLAFQTKNRGDIYNNLWNGKETGDEERHSGRVQLAFEPSDRLRILANGHVTFQSGDRQPFKAIGLLDADRLAAEGLLDENGKLSTSESLAALLRPDRGLLCPTLNEGQDQFAGRNNCVSTRFDIATLENLSTSDWQDVLDAAPNVADVDFYGGFLRLEYDFESFSITSLSSLDKLEVLYMENTSGSHFAGFFPGQDADYEVFQQELRLTSTHDGPWRWIFGGYYSYEDDTLATIIRNNAPGTPPFSVIPSIEIQQEVDIYSVYGKIDIDISDSLTVFGGLRWTQDSKEGISIARIAPGTESGRVGSPRLPDDFFTDLARLRSITADAAAAGAGCPPPPLPCQSPDLPVKQNIKELGGKIGANLQFTDEIMGYVSFSRGFKSGAFDTRALAAFAGTADRPVNPEYLNAIEVGVKSELLDGKLQFNAALFKYDWEDLQIFDVDELGRPAYLNVPETEIVGAEFDIKWAPGAGWFVSYGLGWLDSKITDDGGLNSVKAGSPLNHTPDISFNGLIIKEIPVNNGVLALQTDFQYSDEFNHSLDSNPQTVTEETFFINARASYRFGNEQQFELSVWGENLSSEKTCYDISNNTTLTVANTCMQNPGMAFYGGSFQYDF